ncbi:MAG: membrane protein insertion efficiency factor YidD [Thermodesulfobacteriota bacterium]
MEKDSKNKVIREKAGDESILNMVFIKGIKFFQNVISPVDGDRCPMYPACSDYSIQALRKHGPFLGFVMIADRLMHERDEMTSASTVIVNGIRRYYDPVENNDFWLSEK